MTGTWLTEENAAFEWEKPNLAERLLCNGNLFSPITKQAFYDERCGDDGQGEQGQTGAG